MAEGMPVEGTESATGGMGDGVKKAETGRTLITRTEGAPRRRDASTTGPVVRAHIVAGQGRHPDVAGEAVVVSGRVRLRHTSQLAGIRAARRHTSAVVLQSARRRPAVGPHRRVIAAKSAARGLHRRVIATESAARGLHRRVIATESAARGPLPGGRIRALPRGVDALREGKVRFLQ